MKGREDCLDRSYKGSEGLEEYKIPLFDLCWFNGTSPSGFRNWNIRVICKE